MKRAAQLTACLNFPPPIQPAEYAHRRQLLLEDLCVSGDSPLIVLTSASTTYQAPDVPHKFRQCSNFRYLTGCVEPMSCLVQSESRSWFFCHKKSSAEILWEGQNKTPEQMAKEGGFDEVLPLSELPKILTANLKDNCSLATTERKFNDPIIRKMLECFPGKRLPLQNALDRLRWIKSDAELDHMRCTANIGSEAINAVMQQANGLQDESTLVGLLEFEMRRHGADSQAYPPVVAGGERCNTIHYLTANQTVHHGECVLIDAGADFNGYVSDITRCFPLSGTFTDPQRVLYETLLEIQTDCLLYAENHRPLNLNDLYHCMIGQMALKLESMPKFFTQPMNDEELFKACSKLCGHHVSHYLGMDVHDTPTISRSVNILPKVVITVEPGIYVSKNNNQVSSEFQGIGFRLEDDLLITDTGIEILTRNCKKSATDVEEIMSS